ncbi:TetR/AcrR family transcriptional regulator [Nocardioides pacificus]
MSDRVPPRTQTQRREETIARLLEATAETVHELGYARTTVQAICTRAGLSQGALFRHFPTRRAVLVATAEWVARQQTEEFAHRFAGVDLDEASLLEALRQVRSQVRSRSNQVWHELVRAARTDPELRADLQPALRAFHRRTASTAADFVGAAGGHPDFQTALRIAINYLDGEAAVAEVLPDADRDEETLRLLARMLEDLRTAPAPEEST